MTQTRPPREARPRPSSTHPCVWIISAQDGAWPCRIEREPGAPHEALPAVRHLNELTGRATAHRANRVVVSDRIYAELVAAGVAPPERPAGVVVCP